MTGDGFPSSVFLCVFQIGVYRVDRFSNCILCRWRGRDSLYLPFGWFVPPAVYFLLVEKVHKAPLKPLRFQPSRQSKETALQKSNGTSSLQMRIVCPARPLLRKGTENTAFSLECRVFAWLGSLLQHLGSIVPIDRTTEGLAGRIQRGVAPLFVSF